VDLGIRNRKAIVTGASVGLGKSSAVALAREGVELFVSARGRDRLHAAAEEIAKETGARVIPVVADNATRAGREALLAACPEPDILVINCSPPKQTDDFRDITEEDWHASLATTLIGPVEMMKSVIDGMVGRSWGRIVNIATAAAKYPAEFRLLSGPSRSALVNYTVALSKKVAKDNVIINNVLAGFHRTPSMDAVLAAWAEKSGRTCDEELLKMIERLGIPVGRLGDPDDFGAFCAMYCSQYARGIVGQNVVIDGGLIHGMF
jgi:3-oxoacyl-[acyl-carrier protein] reductase